MASIELRKRKIKNSKRVQEYYLLVARVCVGGKMTRRYSNFDFDPTVLKNRNSREAAALAAARDFEVAEQQRIDEAERGGGKTFAVVAAECIADSQSKLSPESRLEGDYETHKDKANTTRGKNNMLTKIKELAPELANKPMAEIKPRDFQAFLDKLGSPGVRGTNGGSAVLLPGGKDKKTMTCKAIADKCSVGVDTVEIAFKEKRVSVKTAMEIADALGIPCEKLFRIELNNKPLCRKTVREYANFFHLVGGYAAKAYDIPSAAAGIKVKNGTATSNVDCIHDDELQRLMAALADSSELEQIIVGTLLNTGMRRGELAGLLWDDFDFTNNTVSVVRTLQYGGGYHVTAVKMNNPRTVDVAPEYMAEMKMHFKKWREQKKRMGASWQRVVEGRKEGSEKTLTVLTGKNFVVCDDHGWPLNPDSYADIVKRVGARAGIPRLHPHMMRHTFVSILMADPDVDIATVSKLAGHASPAVTLRIYTQQYKRHNEAVRNRMRATLYGEK